MNEKLYIGNLPYDATEEDLKNLFGQAGTVTSVILITDRESGRAKGFGFIEMGSQAEAEEAIRMFNSHDLKGRALNVSVARPKEKREGGRTGGGFGGRSGGGGQRGGGGGYGGRGGSGGGGGGRDRNRRDNRDRD